MSGERAAETRERILDVALRLFVEMGYDKCSLREIAEELGFSKAALYYHFRSKDEILRVLVERMLDELEPIVLGIDLTLPIATRLKQFVLAWIDMLISTRSAMQMMMQAHSLLHSEETLKDIHDRFHVVISKLAEGLGGGDGADPVARARATFVIGGLLDVAVQTQDETPTELLREIMANLASSVLGTKINLRRVAG